MKECLECHADDVRRPASQAARCSPERATQRCGQTDGDLIVHEGILQCVHCNCSATHCSGQDAGGSARDSDFRRVPLEAHVDSAPASVPKPGNASTQLAGGLAAWEAARLPLQGLETEATALRSPM